MSGPWAAAQTAPDYEIETGVTNSVSETPAPWALDCAAGNVRCVGSGQEYTTIQAAANATVAGDTVLVFDGTYTGFEVKHSGTPSAQIAFKAEGQNVVIDKPGASEGGILINAQSYVTIEGFHIENVSLRCISTRDSSSANPNNPMAGLIIRNNTCKNAAREGIYLSEVGNSLIEGNSVDSPGSSNQQRSHGLYLANAGSDDTIVRGNTISNVHANDSAGMHFNGDESVGGDGIISGLLIEDNIIHGGAQNGLNMDGVQDSIIRNNLVYDNEVNALSVYRIDGAEGPKNMKIVNNTFIVPSGSSDWCVHLQQDLGGHVIFNNVLIHQGSDGGSIAVGHSNLISDHNAAINRFSVNGGNSIISFTQWKSNGYDANSFLSTAALLFLDLLGEDFTLKLGAPAIDAGVASLGGVAAPADDLEGHPRPQGLAYDLGAYEKGGGSGGDTTPPGIPQNLSRTDVH
jgi:parallel beta-helix repeat protein